MRPDLQRLRELCAKCERIRHSYEGGGFMAAMDYQADMNPINSALADAVPALIQAAEERDRLRERVGELEDGVRRILEISADRQAFVMMGPRAFAKAEQIARALLGKEGT
jgi:hypothetical protein